MFHAPMGRFQLELTYYFTYFFTVVPSNSCVFPVSLSLLILHFQQTEETSTPTRPVENVLTTKGLQERNTQLLDGTRVEK